MHYQFNPLPFLILAFVGLVAFLAGGWFACGVACAVWLGVVIVATLLS